jgi:hypothetical protein
MKPSVRWRFNRVAKAWMLSVPDAPVAEAYAVPDEAEAYLFVMERWPAEVRWRAAQ